MITGAQTSPIAEDLTLAPVTGKEGYAIVDGVFVSNGAMLRAEVTTPIPVSADSLQLLARVVRLLEGRNYQVVNVDVTVVCESPRIGPHAPAMQERLAGVLGIAPDHISIKGKSNEGLGWIGRGEGIAAFAVALIDSLENIDALHARHRRDASL